MFSVVCVCLSFCSQGGSLCDHYPLYIGPVSTGPLIQYPPTQGPAPSVQGPSPSHPIQGPSPLLVTYIGQDWRPVQTCSLEDLTVQALTFELVLTSGGWLLTHPTGMLFCFM